MAAIVGSNIVRYAPAMSPLVGLLKDMVVVGRVADVGKRGPLIGTHDGTFHADEVCALAMLKMLPTFRDAAVIRSRDPKELEECDVVVDVGAVYDPERKRYDHHQRGFEDVMAEIGHKTKLSSFGLIYRHYGREFIESVINAAQEEASDAAAASVDVDVIYRRVYKRFVEHIDGIDNGVEAFDSSARNYEVSTKLSDRVGAFNPSWNEPADEVQVNARFSAAVDLAAAEVTSHVEGCVRSWWPARSLVKAAFDGASTIHPSRQILVLTQYCPWSSHLFELEQEISAAGDPVVGTAKYVVFGGTTGSDWRVQAVPVEEGSFASRLKLPESWRGLRDEKLSEHIGIEGCIFVHAGGFIGGHQTREGALAMAVKALDG